MIECAHQILIILIKNNSYRYKYRKFKTDQRGYINNFHTPMGDICKIIAAFVQWLVIQERINIILYFRGIQM